MRRLLLLSVAILSLSVLACGETDKINDPPPEPPILGTPEAAIKRFIMTYERKNLTEYNKLFTGDFVFEFSASADPELVHEYSAGWHSEDELMATQNLFHGGVNSDGQFVAGAQSIDLDLVQGVPQDDNGDGRDPETHVVLFTPVRLEIQLPPDHTDPDGVTLVVGGADPALHRFFLVRGDAAMGLEEDQPADDRHWYIWLWRDESTVSRDRRGAVMETESTSWGRVKSTYR